MASPTCAVALSRLRCSMGSILSRGACAGVGAVAGFGKAEGWERTNAVVARAVTKAVAEDPLLGAAGSDAEMETAAIAVEARLLEGVDLG